MFNVSGLGSDNAITAGPDGNIWLTVQDAPTTSSEKLKLKKKRR